VWWLRRTLVAGFFATLLVFAVPTASMAAEPPPPPVIPLQTLPSNAASTGATVTEWQKAKALASTPAVDVLRSIPGSTAAKILGGWFAMGFAIGSGGLTAYAIATGDNPVAGACSNGAGVQLATGILYPQLAPDCNMDVPDQNPDVVEGWSLSHGAWNVRFLGHRLQTSNGAPRLCIKASGPLPTGYNVYRLNASNGVWDGAYFGYTPGDVTVCKSASGHSGPTYPDATAWLSSQPGTNSLNPGPMQLRYGATQVVAESTMADPNPDRQLSCRVSFTNGTSAVSMGATYNDAGGIPTSARSFGCADAFAQAAGRTASNISVLSDGDPMIDAPVLETGDLILSKLVDDKWVTCMTWAVDCSGWWDETLAGTIEGAYSCTYAGSVVPLTECSPYQTTFDTRDGCPQLTEPTTGEPVAADCKGDPNSTDPGSVVTPGEDCYDSWSDEANPLEWVVKPIQCGLVSLFVPRPDVVKDSFDGAIGKWENTMPGQVSGIVETTFTVPSGGSGCQGPQVLIPLSSMGQGWVDIDFYPLAACASPMSDVAAWSRVLSAAVLVYATAVGVVRRISSVVNAPGIN
jgi:hypothetical protein